MTQNIQKFINQPEIQSILDRTNALKEKKRFSDIEDEEGNQYVDLVQEGGGVLGVALVGYTYVLENAGIRFFSLAGTSAGAINTMMIAALGKINDAKSEKILEILSEKDLFELVDGDKNIRKLVQKAISKEKGIGWGVAWNAIRIYKTLKHKLGLNPGDNFEEWIIKKLSGAGINTLKDLNELRAQLPNGLKNVADGNIERLNPRLAIITSDVTTHTKVEFPKMVELYWSDPEEVSPAKFVRASMSIPYFFEPFEVEGIPKSGNVKDPKWDEYAKYFGEVPRSVKFVDGGMLSNFPINVFHREDGGVPRMPTFGARLSTYRESFSETDSFFGFSGAMVSTMRQIHDYDFLMRNPDYRKLICRIDADQQFNWLNFNMSIDEQIELFTLGARKAIAFLEEFDWEAYKQIRARIKTV